MNLLSMLRYSSQKANAKNKVGATAIEYGLIAAGISLAIIAVVNGLGTNLNTKFTNPQPFLTQSSAPANNK